MPCIELSALRVEIGSDSQVLYCTLRGVSIHGVFVRETAKIEYRRAVTLVLLGTLTLIKFRA